MRLIEPMEEGNIYHIYNRGINSTNIFSEKRNYYFFLEKYQEYCFDILETYAYALLKNHFHLLVKVRENIIVQRKDGKGEIRLNASKQLSHFFNSYAQSYNAAYNRHGKLFEEPFKRKIVDGSYFTSLVCYIHLNPQLYHFVKDFREWEFISWNAIVGNTRTFIAKDKVIERFGSIQSFNAAHLGEIPDNNIIGLNGMSFF